MIISVCIVHNARFVFKWSIVDADESNDGLSFSQIFEHMKAGLVTGIPVWPWPLQSRAQCNQEPVESVDVTIESVHVGKNPENLIACTPTLVAARTCSTFGEFVKFSLKIEHPADCICLHEGQAQGLTAGNQTAVKDAFSMMMSAARVAARDSKTLPDPVEERNQLDKLHNKVIALLKNKKLGWDSSRHFTFVSKLSKILWYIDGHHSTLESRTKKIPEIFRAFCGYNCPEASRHRKRTIDNLKATVLKSHVCTLQEFLGTTWMDQPEWADVKVRLLEEYTACFICHTVLPPPPTLPHNSIYYILNI